MTTRSGSPPCSRQLLRRRGPDRLGIPIIVGTGIFRMSGIHALGVSIHLGTTRDHWKQVVRRPTRSLGLAGVLTVVVLWQCRNQGHRSHPMREMLGVWPRRFKASMIAKKSFC